MGEYFPAKSEEWEIR